MVAILGIIVAVAVPRAIGTRDLQVISAEAPLAEVMRYATELSSMTGGVGSYTMEFDRYDLAPSFVAEKVIAAAKAQKEEG